MLRKTFALFAIAILAAIGLASCGGGSATQGGTLRGIYATFPDYLDPALSYSQEGWTAMYNSYVPLLTYAHADGADGGQVVPGLAKALPKISDDGKTYTLFLRPGLKYSNGAPVKASDFEYAVERLFRLNSGGTPFYTGIVGAEKFAETKSGGISGIEANDKTGEIVIKLTRPRGTFSNELGLMFVAPVPKGTPNKDLSADPPPATGPYVITKSQPGKGWEYARNPVWAKTNAKAMPDLPTGHFDKIKISVIPNSTTQVRDIEQGKAQWLQPPPSPNDYAAVKSKYEGTQFRVEPGTSTYYFWMNTTQAPFNDLKVRQAINYAVNPAALERVYAGQLIGNQQVLPPGIPGYKKFELYPPNMAKAKAMIREANPSDKDITVWGIGEPENREAAEYYDSVLKELGFNTTLKIIDSANYFTVTGNLSTPNLDTGWSNWFADYPHPNDFFQPMLAGESINSTNNTNLAQVDIPEFNEKITSLGEVPLGPRQEAEYATLDRGYMEQAPWAPYGSRTVSTFVSSEINLDNVIFNPSFGQDLTSFEAQ